MDSQVSLIQYLDNLSAYVAEGGTGAAWQIDPRLLQRWIATARDAVARNDTRALAPLMRQADVFMHGKRSSKLGASYEEIDIVTMLPKANHGLNPGAMTANYIPIDSVPNAWFNPGPAALLDAGFAYDPSLDAFVDYTSGVAVTFDNASADSANTFVWDAARDDFYEVRGDVFNFSDTPQDAKDFDPTGRRNSLVDTKDDNWFERTFELVKNFKWDNSPWVPIKDDPLHVELRKFKADEARNAAQQLQAQAQAQRLQQQSVHAVVATAGKSIVNAAQPAQATDAMQPMQAGFGAWGLAALASIGLGYWFMGRKKSRSLT